MCEYGKIQSDFQLQSALPNSRKHKNTKRRSDFLDLKSGIVFLWSKYLCSTLSDTQMMYLRLLCTTALCAALMVLSVSAQKSVPKKSPVKPPTPQGTVVPLETRSFSNVDEIARVTSEEVSPQAETSLSDGALKALVITAHPDDETCFAVSMYKITKELGGVVDLAVITNGEAGYKYSTLANDLYNLNLTDEEVGREYLPAIRKRELMAGGKYAGIRNYYFFDQKDTHYTLDADTVLRMVWDVEWVKKRLRTLMEREHYDIVFTLLPTPETHGHHKAATIIALEVAKSLTAPAKPAVLGCGSAVKSDSIPTFGGLAGYPITKCGFATPMITLDKTQKFGYNDRLNYTIITSWMVAEHKSQGAMHLGNRSELEQFWFFDINDSAALPAVKGIFERMAKSVPKKR